MYAVVTIAGQQFKVKKDEQLLTPKLSGEPGDAMEFETVLLIADEENVKVGTPTVTGAVVKATIVAHTRGKKIVVFKKKRRKGYRVKNGHRQDYTKIKINEII